jgi:hypothetical protein
MCGSRRIDHEIDDVERHGPTRRTASLAQPWGEYGGAKERVLVTRDAS